MSGLSSIGGATLHRVTRLRPAHGLPPRTITVVTAGLLALLRTGDDLAQGHRAWSGRRRDDLSMDLRPPTLGPCDPMAPRRGAHTESNRPRFTWSPLPPSTASATLEVARDHAFQREVHHAVVTGSSGVLGEPLEPGRWFWRLRGEAGTPTVSMFVVRARGGAPGVSWGFEADVDGDGASDLVLGFHEPDARLAGRSIPLERLTGTAMDIAPRWSSPRSQRWLALSGMDDVDGDGATDFVVAVGPDAEAHIVPSQGSAPPGSAWGLHTGRDVHVMSVYPVGDLDRDGLADLAGTASIGREIHPFVALLRGGVRVLPTMPDGSLELQVRSAGDVDADGFEDVVFVTRGGRAERSCVRWVPGGPMGVDMARARQRCEDAGSPWRFVGPVAAGDFDGDGDADLALTEQDALEGTPRVVVFDGGPEALRVEAVRHVTVTGPDATVHTVTSTAFGAALAAADTDADGVDELWIRDPDAAGGRGRLFGVRAGPGAVATVDGAARDRTLGFSVGDDLATVGTVDDAGHTWLATDLSANPLWSPTITLVGGSPPAIRATIVAEGERLELVPGPLGSPPPDPLAADVAAVFTRDVAALAQLERAHPRLALAVATLAALDAHDPAAVRRLHARQLALPSEGFLYLEVVHGTPLDTAFDALRVGLIAEMPRGLVLPVSVCEVLLRDGGRGLRAFNDQWGSSQSGPSEEARWTCYAPLLARAVDDGARTDDVLTLVNAIHRGALRVVPEAPGPGAEGGGGSMEIGLRASLRDGIDSALFGIFPDALPSARRLTAFRRRIERAPGTSHFPDVRPRFDAFLRGLESRLPVVADAACALRRLRGVPADREVCVAWVRVAVAEAVASYLADAWGTVRSPVPHLDTLDQPVW